jgi:protein-disulfide isomerase
MPKAKEKTTIETKQKVINLQALPESIRKINFRAVMVVALIIMAFVIGRLSQRVEDLEKGVTTGTGTTTTDTTQTGTTTVTIDQIKDLWNKDVIKFGDTSKKVLFVEVGDPSCPYCHAAGGENHTIYQALGGTTFQLVADGGTYQSPVLEMRKLIDSGAAGFAYVYYPGHGNGEMGMKALYCANEKGKFWQAHDLLMSDKGYDLLNNTVKNDKAQSGTIANFLKSAVDPTFLKSCLDSGKYDSTLTSDMSIASSLGVQGTPGFFVNTTSYPGAYSWTDMKATVDSALQ